MMDSVRAQLKPLILKSLRIADLTPDALGDDQPLIGGELDIDSIDVLQLILEIEKTFGIRLVGGKFDRAIWESVNTLAAAIEAKIAELPRR